MRTSLFRWTTAGRSGPYRCAGCRDELATETLTPHVRTAILTGPTSGVAEGEASVVGQGDPVFQKGTKEFEAREGPGTLGLREAASPTDAPFIGEWCQIASKKPCQILVLPHSRYCWRIPQAASAAINFMKDDVRVPSRGRSANQSVIRTTFMAVAVATCCR
jgi:hypothetical protein